MIVCIPWDLPQFMNERSELSRSLRALPDSHARAKEGVLKIDSKCDPGEFSASIKNGFSGSVSPTFGDCM